MHFASSEKFFQCTRSDRVSKTTNVCWTPHAALTYVECGVVCLHVDAMLGTSDELFASKLKKLDELVGFGSMKRQKVRSLRKAVLETCQRRNHDFHEGIHPELEEESWMTNFQRRKVTSSEASTDVCNG